MVIDAASVDAALAALASEMSHALQTRVTAFVRSGQAWRPIDAAHNMDCHGWLAAVGPLTSDACTLVRCGEPGASTATLIPIGAAGRLEAVVIADGDWTPFDENLRSVTAVAGVALEALRDREQRVRAERQLIGGYAMARRLSRLGSVESVAQQIVDSVAEMIKAERVSLSLYKSSDDALSIVATHGYPHSEVAEVRVRPGAWVVGHVYASRRPLFVSDVRVLPEMARRSGEYRTFGFAAVPLLAGRETVGVLTATDKTDGRPFNHDDEMVLRALSVTAAVALVAARSNNEAAQLAYAATIDPLTGLMNRTSLDHRLHQEVERSKREKTSLALLMADVDDFKRINDSRGHQVGDAVLRAVATVIRSAVRVFDVCARYGGDEFAIVMPNCDRQSAVACAERIRARLGELRQQTDDSVWPGRLTLSIGVAVLGEDEDAADLVERADHCLYKAKADGKDAVRSDEPAKEVVLGPRPVPPRSVAAEPAEPAEQTAEPLPGDITQLPYVLVVDTDDARVNLCLQAVQPFRCGLLVAGTGTLAGSVIERFGPPILLVVDLALPDAFAAMDALSDRNGGTTDLVAWSASKEAREFAASKMRFGRIISTTAGDAAMTAAIQGALQRRNERGSRTAEEDRRDGAAARVASELVRDVRRLCSLPGIAVYLKDPVDEGFRVTFDWAAEDMPLPPVDVPSVFSRVRESGRTVFDRDPGEAITEPGNVVRGIIGVPIVANRQVVGVICAFDVKPLHLDAQVVAALEQLGSRVLEPARHREIAARQEVAARVDHRTTGRPDAAGAAPPGPLLDQQMLVHPVLLERTGGEFAVARELSRAKRDGRQLSVVLFSVAPGQALPHDPADQDLDELAETFVKAVRQSDLPIRWSVTELLVVLPGLGSKEAKAVAERVRAALSAGIKNRVAVSGGVEEVEPEGSFLDVIDRARRKVAIAVDRGHNRVV